MTLQPAEFFTLSHGGNTVRLRASLRAAMTLERAFGGFGPLFRQVSQSHLGTFQQVIRATATDPDAADRLLDAAGTQPLESFFTAATAPVQAVCAALLPGDTDATEAAKSRKPKTTTKASKPKPWSVFFSDLFKIATGWLGWSATDTWNATTGEIIEAFEGWTDMQKAMHPSGEPEENADAAQSREEQRQANIELGLDPDFDRAGLRALKARMS